MVGGYFWEKCRGEEGEGQGVRKRREIGGEEMSLNGRDRLKEGNRPIRRTETRQQLCRLCM